MRSARWKFFINYEKEEAWLNEMSAKGFAFREYFLLRYSFEDSEPGEYIYRIELLENWITHPESQRYIGFLKENGVEAVATWGRWVYFRRRAEEGAFDIYSDVESRLTHYRRVGVMFLVVGLAEIMIGVGQIPGVLWYLSGEISVPMSLIALVLLWGLGGVFLFAWNSLRRKIKMLKREKNLRE